MAYAKDDYYDRGYNERIFGGALSRRYFAEAEELRLRQQVEKYERERQQQWLARSNGITGNTTNGYLSAFEITKAELLGMPAPGLAVAPKKVSTPLAWLDEQVSETCKAAWA